MSTGLDLRKDNLLKSSRLRRGARPSDAGTAASAKANSSRQYASDTEYSANVKPGGTDRLSSAATSSTQPKFPIRKIDKDDTVVAPKKPFAARPFRVQEEYKFKWVPPVKTFPEKYGPTKIKII